MSIDPIDLLFGGMEKLGPGSNADTRKVLEMLPDRKYEVVVDAGCGTGRQTLVLAETLQVPIQAVDIHQPFLDDLNRRAKDSGLDGWVTTHCLDMQKIPDIFKEIDLLWSEGAAYSIGFENALRTWSAAITVVSELCWLQDSVPEPVRGFFEVGYPDMKSVEENRALLEGIGYRILATHNLPERSWIDGYYDTLRERAEKLKTHTDEGVRDMATETLKEIEIFAVSEGSYGYVFFLLAPEN